MAETCIVCLGDLVPQDEDQVPATDALLVDDGAEVTNNDHHSNKLLDVVLTPNDPAPKDEDLIAHLLPCGHNLHNECLKPWVERANSCPICRASFNMVELSARIGGEILNSYAVQDKRQVADIDPTMIVEDDYFIEDEVDPDNCCMVCDDVGDASQLMSCHSCGNYCHVFCAGLDDMPRRGPWYCQHCMENPSLLRTAGQRLAMRGPSAFANGPSAYANPRSRTNRTRRRSRAPDEWVGVWQSVWDRLHFDIEFPFEEDDQSESRSMIQRRENEEWERRFELARQMGAGSGLRAAADTITTLRQRPVNRTLHREAPQTPKSPKDPESQEELRAWNAFEKAREQVAEDGAQQRPASVSSNNRRRKRKSPTASPAEPNQPEPQPERKLKRPRTRLNLNIAESSATAAARRPTAASPPAATTNGDESNAPGFLQSLLQEVEVDRFAEDREIAAPQPKRIIVDRACSPQNSSPGLSPIYPTPHGMSTPPPLNLGRTDSPTQRDQQLSPTYSPYSPADDDVRRDRRKLAHRQRSVGLSSPPRSKDSSPNRSTLSYSTKRELQLMVTSILKPMYSKKEISKDDYTDINRDVSRLLYDRVAEAGADALASQDAREQWQKTANEEVDSAIKGLSANRAAASLIAEDSASSSS